MLKVMIKNVSKSVARKCENVYFVQIKWIQL